MSNCNYRAILLPVLLIIMVGGCATTDPYTGEKQSSSATTGAVFGALAGALIGSATASKHDRNKAVLLGAGIGALTGGAVGNYMDKQEDELRKQLQGTGVSVTRTDDNIILNMPSNITFDVNRFELKQQFLTTLDSVVLVLNKYPSTLITVKGHTDSTGSNEHNQKLSENRALSVASYLVNKGIKQQRVAAVGRGETEPVADNNTEQGRALNRRVELTLEPIVAKNQ